MALTRQQLRQQAIKAQWEAEMGRPPTRKQARAWIEPLHRALTELLKGEVYAVKGYPIFHLKWAGNPVARIDHSLNGFVDLVKRMDPQYDTGPISRLSNKLTYGVLLTEQEVQDAITSLLNTESLIIKHTRAQLMDWVRTEQISCALHGQA